VRKVVSLVDTAPTILDLMGFPPPSNYQGRTLLDGTPQMALFFADYSLGLLGLRDGARKMVYEIGSGRSRLFNLERDPQERTDVAAREAARASWYGKVLRSWSSSQKRYIARGAVH
jgi:arylsulfatase A-like enzyme